VAFGSNDVRTAPQDVDGLVRAADGRHVRNDARIRAEFCRIGPRLCAHQHIEPVQLRFERHAQARNGGACLTQQGFSLRHFAFVGCTSLLARFHEFQQTRIGIHLVLRDGQLRLQPSDLQIGVGSVGSNRHARAELSGLGRLLFVRGGRVCTPQTAGQIDFPACRRTGDIFLLVAAVVGKRARNRAKRTLRALVYCRVRRIGIDRRKQAGASRLSRCARLGDPRDRSLETQVLIERTLHHLDQFGVVESRPPAIETRGRQRRLTVRDDLRVVKRRHLRIGRNIVRPDGAGRKQGADDQTTCDRFRSSEYEAVHFTSPLPSCRTASAPLTPSLRTKA
jgi:hypothetical protein